MKNFRTYGNKPYSIALLHGGPGAAGSLGKLARKLSMDLKDSGVLEPLQTADSLEGQLEELRETLEQHAELPTVLMGHSWGAMLGYLFAAKHPSYVKQLIMVGSGLFEASYAKNIMQTRLNRMSPGKQAELDGLMDALEHNNSIQDPDLLFHQIGKLLEAADSFDLMGVPNSENPENPDNSEILKGQYQIYQKVWPEVEKIREAGGLLSAGKNIQCPVVAIHGDFDSHPYQGVKEPLSRVLDKFDFFLIEKCGHEPWRERFARARFFELIFQYLT